MNKRERAVKKPRKVPLLKTDEEAEVFIEKDLSNLDYKQFRSVSFNFPKKKK